MKKEKLLIIVDVEGCVGVYENNANATQLMQNELDFVLDNLSQMCDITVVDLHGGGGNIKLHEKHKNVVFADRFWQLNINIKYDKAVLLGFHAKHGADGILSHSFRPEFSKIKIGNIIAGEIGILTNWLRSLKVPVILVTGDTAIANEAQLFNIDYLSVKDKNDISKNIDFTATYEKIAMTIKNNINKEIMIPDYNESKIYIKLKNSDLLNYLPNKIFKVKDEILEFDNTVHFVNFLYEFAAFLNAANYFLDITLKKFILYVRQNYTKITLDTVDDMRFQHILNETDMLNIKISDIDYCYKILASKTK